MNYSDNPEKPNRRSLAEWISFGVSLSILALLVGAIVYQWITEENQPPILSVTTEKNIRQAKGQFYVPFTVANTGNETAESVEVMAELDVNGKMEEIGSQQINFLSGGETQSGAFILNRNPDRGKLIVRVTGYKLP
jgi:uncharacterized protein (TIGR02588 family)